METLQKLHYQMLYSQKTKKSSIYLLRPVTGSVSTTTTTATFFLCTKMTHKKAVTNIKNASRCSLQKQCFV